ncbi:MAG: hydroxyacid dehydrogenase [Protaetiibacter sp.]
MSDESLNRLASISEFDLSCYGQADTGSDRADLDAVEIIFGSWGAPVLTRQLLDRMPSLRVLVYAAGSVKHLLTEEAIKREIRVSSAAQVNARPVAEYTLAMIILGLKRVFEWERSYRRDGWTQRSPGPVATTGMYGRTVGIVGASHIGKRVIELLRPFDVRVLLSDPYNTVDDPAIRHVSLEELLEGSDVVSLHCPLTPETERMIGAPELRRMRTGATLINTARGGLVDEEALVQELRRGRISAILDVTDPLEPLPHGHPLLRLDNVTVTPHLAGSFGSETRRLGEFAVSEVQRYLRGERMHGEVDIRSLARQA